MLSQIMPLRVLVAAQDKHRRICTCVVSDQSAFGAWRTVASAPRLGVDRAVVLAEREGGPGAAARASIPSGRTRADMHPPVTTANLGVECADFMH